MVELGNGRAGKGSGLEENRGSESGSGSNFNSHDRQCEVLTFLYMMGKVWGLLSSNEVALVVRRVVRDGDKWLKEARVEDRICACGSVFLKHGQLAPEVLERMGENCGLLMKEIFGPEKGQELLARIGEQGSIQDDGNS